MTTPQTSEWAPPASLAEFTAQYNADPSALYKNLVALFEINKDTATRYRGERDTARSQLEEANQAIDNLEEQTTQLSLDLNIARAGHASAASTAATTQQVPALNFRSEKFPDPEKFNGSRAKLPGFLTQLRMKLEVNHDRFRNEAAKVIYSISRLEGRALDQIVPLVNSKPSAPFPSVNAFISHLDASFGDPDPRGTARRELLALKQGSGDFASYYSQFLRIIAYLDYNEAAKIDALTEGLSEDLKDALMYRTDKPNNLQDFATNLMTIDNRIRGRKADQRFARNPMGQFSSPNAGHPSHVPGGLAPMDLSALQSRATLRPPIDQRYSFVNGTRKLTAAEKQWRRENNLCMYCAGSGHVFDNCPSSNRLKNAQPTMTGALLEPSIANDTASSEKKVPCSSFQ
ncbi:hypothetical protein K3495_g15264 [Podosphaera aphanis]|nr:hypothetical protein K3495_g15264 [Podosphaera aphanis]